MRRILVIDDEPVLRMTFKHMLEQHGYEVWVAENGLHGVTLCREVAPNLVITDILMPEQDGFTTIDTLHREFPELPIIAMSAVVGPAGRQQSLKLGAFCCVTKPIDSVALIRIIDQVLGQPHPNGVDLGGHAANGN